jgi:hypothetical protein
MPAKEQRHELGAFLRARRAALRPGDVGLPEGINRRRTPGLRARRSRSWPESA